jgi:hypothetical protein
MSLSTSQQTTIPTLTEQRALAVSSAVNTGARSGSHVRVLSLKAIRALPFYTDLAMTTELSYRAAVTSDIDWLLHESGRDSVVLHDQITSDLKFVA